MGPGSILAARLSPQQRRAILLLAEGVTPGEVAERLGASRQTVYNWRSGHPGFRQALAELQAAQYLAGREALQGLLQEAAHTLGAIMANTAARDADRIAAARTVLQFGLSEPPPPSNPTLRVADDAVDALVDDIFTLVSGGTLVE
jgi:hypothetical protein